MFLELQGLHRELGLRLRTHAGVSTFPDVTVKHPDREDDELSFIRLVIWCYVVVNESGRVALRFLRDLPPLKDVDLLPEASILRTWATHNLLPEKESDRKKLRQSWAWFRDACGTQQPSSEQEWRACFGTLASRAQDVFERALRASEALGTQEDGQRLREELSRRVERDWEAHRFDPIVVKVAGTLGFSGIEAKKLRERNLDAWRKVVAVADDGRAEDLLERRIEKDVLDLMNGALPLSAREVLELAPGWGPPEFGALMLALRSSRASKRAATGLLSEAVKQFQTASEVGP